jgi:hypothetical protein
MKNSRNKSCASNPEPALLVVAVFSRHADAIDWARDRLEETFGPVALASPLYSFHHTRYYEPSMGSDLRKRFLAFENLVEPDRLAAIKLQTGGLELELVRTARYAESRPLNLDPGFLQLGKFMLATTKDQAHRIYLHDGIYAEVTLRFEAGRFEPWPWTYADYREEFVRDFLKSAREFYRTRLSSARSENAISADLSIPAEKPDALETQ